MTFPKCQSMREINTVRQIHLLLCFCYFQLTLKQHLFLHYPQWLGSPKHLLLFRPRLSHFQTHYGPVVWKFACSRGYHQLARLAFNKSLCSWPTLAVVFPSFSFLLCRNDATWKDLHCFRHSSLHFFIRFWENMAQGYHWMQFILQCHWFDQWSYNTQIYCPQRSIESSSKIKEINTTVRGVAIGWGGGVVGEGRGWINRAEQGES